MNIDQLHEQMDREAIRLADHLFAYCDVDPHSTLAGKVLDLEVGELVALQSPLRFRSRPGALRVIVPSAEDHER